MSKSIFSDKSRQPSMREVYAVLGKKQPDWEGLTRLLRENYRAKEEFKYYGKNLGWALRFRKGSKALISLYPGENSFIVQLVLGPSLFGEVTKLKLGKSVRQIFENAHDYPEGRWLFIPIKTGRELGDVKRILEVKSPPRRKQITEGG
jgi:hypothetical protein